MDLTLCGQSAFNYYRIPPQVLGLYPAISLGNMDRRCCGLGSHAVVKTCFTHRFTGLYSLGHNPGREACLNRTS